MTDTKTKTPAEIFAEEAAAKRRADQERARIRAAEEKAEAELEARVDEWDDVEWVGKAKERGVELDRQERQGFGRFPDDLAAAFAGYIDGRAAQIVKATLQTNANAFGLPAGGVKSSLPTQVEGWRLVERLDGIIEGLARDKADEMLEELAAQRRAIVEGES